MKSVSIKALLAVLPVWALSLSLHAYGATFWPVGFNEMVERSAVIVEGRVVELAITSTQGPNWIGPIEQDKASRSPRIKPQGGSPKSGGTAPAQPVGVPVEGGRMIFTRVTLEPLEMIKGPSSQTIEFLIPGGTLDGRTAVVPGMPKFEEDERYIVFLRDGYPKGADPMVGGNQGFFRVVRHPDLGREVLLNADSDYVLGIEDNRLILRHNPKASHGPVRQMTGPPEPDDPGVNSVTSPEVRRYWTSAEAPMAVTDFTNEVRSRLKTSSVRDKEIGDELNHY